MMAIVIWVRYRSSHLVDCLLNFGCLGHGWVCCASHCRSKVCLLGLLWCLLL